jgi:hypothetical protein
MIYQQRFNVTNSNTFIVGRTGYLSLTGGPPYNLNPACNFEGSLNGVYVNFNLTWVYCQTAIASGLSAIQSAIQVCALNFALQGPVQAYIPLPRFPDLSVIPPPVTGDPNQPAVGIPQFQMVFTAPAL